MMTTNAHCLTGLVFHVASWKIIEALSSFFGVLQMKCDAEIVFISGSWLHCVGRHCRAPSVYQHERRHVSCFLHDRVVGESDIRKVGIRSLVFDVDVHFQRVGEGFVQAFRLPVVGSCPWVSCLDVFQYRLR